MGEELPEIASILIQGLSQPFGASRWVRWADITAALKGRAYVPDPWARILELSKPPTAQYGAIVYLNPPLAPPEGGEPFADGVLYPRVNTRGKILDAKLAETGYTLVMLFQGMPGNLLIESSGWDLFKEQLTSRPH